MAASLCYDCGSSCDPFDNYCRACGASLRVRRLPAVLPERRLGHLQTAMVATALGRGVLAFIAAKVLAWGVRFVVRRAVTSMTAPRTQVVPVARQATAVSPEVQPVEPLPPGDYTVATLILRHVSTQEGGKVATSRRRWLFLAR